MKIVYESMRYITIRVSKNRYIVIPKWIIVGVLLLTTAQAQQPTVAVSIDRQEAINYLHGRCVPELTPWDSRPQTGHILIILERGKLADPLAIASALSSALHAHEQSIHLDKGKPIPPGFRDVGDGFNDERNIEVDLIAPELKAVRFCR